MPQFSLRTVFLLVLLISVSLAAIVSVSEKVLFGLRLALIFLPLMASFMAAYFDGSRRAFWIGVAVFGFWSEHSLSQARWFNKPLERPFVQVIGPPIARLHSSRIQHEAYEEMHESGRYAALTLQQIKDQLPEKWDQYVRMKENNLQARTGYLGRKCIQLFVALLGGVMVAWIHRVGNRSKLPQS